MEAENRSGVYLDDTWATEAEAYAQSVPCVKVLLTNFERFAA